MILGVCLTSLLVVYSPQDLDKKREAKTILESFSKSELIAQSPKLGLLIQLLHKWRSEGKLNSFGRMCVSLVRWCVTALKLTINAFGS